MTALIKSFVKHYDAVVLKWGKRQCVLLFSVKSCFKHALKPWNLSRHVPEGLHWAPKCQRSRHCDVHVWVTTAEKVQTRNYRRSPEIYSCAKMAWRNLTKPLFKKEKKSSCDNNETRAPTKKLVCCHSEVSMDTGRHNTSLLNTKTKFPNSLQTTR